MKKLIALALCLLLLLTLAACTGEPEQPSTQATTAAPTETTVPEKGPFLVGYGRQDITPNEGDRVHLGGSDANRFSESILDHVYATCIAFTDADGETLLLFHMDLARTDMYASLARLHLSKEYDLPIENVIISATHTHAAPDTKYYHDSNYPRDNLYMDEILFPGIYNAAKEALEDRKPAELYGSSIETVGLNFNRHYLLDDGSVAGDHFGNFTGRTIIRHMVEQDTQMQVLRFKREGGKDVVMINWQAHPHKNGVYGTAVSSDFVSPMRDYLEAELDCQVAYFTGASGNVNCGSRVTAENLTADYVEHGQEVARYALLALENAKPMELGRIQAAAFMSHASKADMPISAFAIGDVGFAVAPYEMFSENGEFIKDNSPFDTTFVVTCANGKFGYFPSEATYAYYSYEERAYGIPKGNAEEVAASHVDLLNQLFPSRYLPGTTGIDAQTYDGPLYWNLDRGVERVKKIDGSYDFRFLVDGEVVEYRLTNRNLISRIDGQNLMGLTLEGDKIVGVHSLTDTPYARITDAYYVESVSDNAVVVNAHRTLKGRQITLALDDSVKLWDATKGCAYTGKIASTSRVTALADSTGKLVSLYITDGSSASEIAELNGLETSERYCEHCRKDVTFYHWTSTDTLPRLAAHYLLTADVNLTETQGLNGGEVCVDLGGKTVTMLTPGKRVYYIQTESTLTVQDSEGTGTIRATEGASSGLIIQCEHENGVFELHGGTLDASGCEASYSTAVYMKDGKMNMYGGTIIGGETYGIGSGCVSVGAASEFEMFGGTMTGGHSKETRTTVNSPAGGGLVRVTGVATIHGGTFTAGKSDYCGGNLFVRTGGILKLLGGTVSGGTCKENGAGVYLETACTLVLGGDVNITGNNGSNLYAVKGSVIQVDTAGLSGAKIGIGGAEGVFLKGTFTQADADCFVSDDPSMKVVLTAEGIALEKA